MSHSETASWFVRFLRMCRNNSLAVVCFSVGAVGGAVLANLLPVSDTMTPVQRALGGALCGAWFAMFPIGFRLYGE